MCHYWNNNKIELNYCKRCKRLLLKFIALFFFFKQSWSRWCIFATLQFEFEFARAANNRNAMSLTSRIRCNFFLTFTFDGIPWRNFFLTMKFNFEFERFYGVFEIWNRKSIAFELCILAIFDAIEDRFMPVKRFPMEFSERIRVYLPIIWNWQAMNMLT